MTETVEFDAAAIAEHLDEAFDSAEQTAPITSDHPTFDVGSAYSAAHELQRRRGTSTVGRKIGFSNRAIWPTYGIEAPMWGWMYAHTMFTGKEEKVAETAGLLEPRIEPEILLQMAKRPRSDMSEEELLGCVGWVGAGFEIVDSPYPGWKFKLPDAIAAGALHSSFHLGSKIGIKAFDGWIEAFKTATVTLHRDGEAVATGCMDTVLGSPLLALKEILAVIEADDATPNVGYGEMIATGTITDAFPIVSGQNWEAVIDGLPLKGATLRVA